MSKKILVVDDSETVRTQLKRDLSDRGYIVVEAADGTEGIARAISEKPDLILCDLNMPGLDGLSMAEQILSTMPVPIFMLTTEASAEAKRRARDIGIRAWVTKPYDPDKIDAGIKKILKTK